MPKPLFRPIRQGESVICIEKNVKIRRKKLPAPSATTQSKSAIAECRHQIAESKDIIARNKLTLGECEWGIDECKRAIGQSEAARGKCKPAIDECKHAIGPSEADKAKGRLTFAGCNRANRAVRAALSNVSY
ncbi:MAG: hypothetical protein E4H40_07925 [Candidatus Brocadiia bacterium]|nr:MAG: hypothetical protein E4H40_07925 [Candidatus Brocadiia bacterium]